jgi:hypothetical protein
MLQKTQWIPVFDNKPASDDVILSAEQAKHVKSCPHRYNELKDYDYLFYFDTKQTMDEKKVEDLIVECFQKNNFSFVITQHPYSVKKKITMYGMNIN